jgi:hypothetical protein
MNVTLTVNGTIEEVKTFLGTINPPRRVEISMHSEEPKQEKEPIPSDEDKELCHNSAYSDRDYIKTELTALGIEFNNKCATKTLAKLLEDNTAKSVAELAELEENPINQEVKKLAQPPSDSPSQPEPQFPSFEHTVDVLKTYAVKNGIAKAEKLLTGFNAEKISDLTGEQRAKLIILTEEKEGQ